MRACTVLIDGRAARSCVTQIGALGDAEIITIEGSAPSTSHTRFSAPSARGTPIRRPSALFRDAEKMGLDQNPRKTTLTLS